MTRKYCYFRLIKGYLTRNGPPTEINKDFIELAKAQWLIRLSKSLPLNILDRRWPPCPYTCTEASKLLEKYYRSHLSRVYRMKLTPERQAQFQLKVLAESLFKGIRIFPNRLLRESLKVVLKVKRKATRKVWRVGSKTRGSQIKTGHVKICSKASLLYPEIKKWYVGTYLCEYYKRLFSVLYPSDEI